MVARLGALGSCGQEAAACVGAQAVIRAWPEPQHHGSAAKRGWPAGAAGPVCGAANLLPTFSFFGFFCFLGAAPAGRRCGGRAPRLIARTPGVSRAGTTPCLPVGHSMLAAWHLLWATGRNAAVGAHIPRRSPPSVAAVAVFLGLPSVFCFLVTLTSCTTRSRRSVAGHQGWHTARASWLEGGRQQGGFKCAASAAAAELPALCATASWPSLPGASCAAQPRLASSSTIWAPPSSSSLSLSLSLPSSLACTSGGGCSRGGQSACWAVGQHVAGHTVPLPEEGPRAHWRCCTALKAETPFQNWHMIRDAHAPNPRPAHAARLEVLILLVAVPPSRDARKACKASRQEVRGAAWAGSTMCSPRFAQCSFSTAWAGLPWVLMRVPWFCAKGALPKAGSCPRPCPAGPERRRTRVHAAVLHLCVAGDGGSPRAALRLLEILDAQLLGLDELKQVGPLAPAGWVRGCWVGGARRLGGREGSGQAGISAATSPSMAWGRTAWQRRAGSSPAHLGMPRNR